MKIFALITIMVLMLSTVVFAETTDNPNWTTPNPSLNNFLNQYATHTHGYEKYERYTELGLMADITLYEDIALGIPYGLGTVSQYDFNNNNWGFYGKVSLNLSPMVKNFMGIK